MTLALPTDNTTPSAAVSIIQRTAQDLSAAMTIARALVQTPFVGQHFQGKPEACAAAILYGATINMDPLTAVQQVFVIGGKPALYARAMVAVVTSHGHEVWTIEAGPTKVIVGGRRKGSDKTETSEWTVERARKAGYTSNKKYDTDPESMLYARASGDVARRVAPDALLGMAYSVEELQLEEQPADEAPSTTARSGVSRLAAAVLAEPAQIEPAGAVEEPAPEPEPEPAVEEGENVQAATTDQLTKIAALFKAQKIQRAAAAAYTRTAISRDVQSSAELTFDEAELLIQTLEEPIPSGEEQLPEPPADWTPSE